MVTIRLGIYETNSSSSCTISVSVYQVENLEIPSVVHIDTDPCKRWKHDINEAYYRASDNLDAFCALLKSVGVREIYVDGRLVTPDPDNTSCPFDKERLLAMSFGEYLTFSEWYSWGGEGDDSSYFSLATIKKLQDYAKNPNYKMYCTDEDGNEIPWNSLDYSTMRITDEDIQREEERMKQAALYEKYESDVNYHISEMKDEDKKWEDEDDYYEKEDRRYSRYDKHGRRRRKG